jgi:hypothetical protein
MKPFSFLKFIFAIAITSTFFTSCTDDGTGTGITGPKVDFAAGTGVITSDATINAGETFTVNLVGTKGDNDMKSITINEAGSKISDITRIAYSHTTGTANPLLLSGNLTSSFDIKITVKAHTDSSTKAYSFVVADDQNNITTKTINITTSAVPPVILSPTASSSVDVKPDSLLVSGYKVTKGSAKLASIEVLINDVKATDLNRIYFGNLQTKFTSNPFSLPVENQDAIDKDIFFRAPSVAGVYVYTVKFIDVNGLSSTHQITANVGIKVTNLVGVLLNSAGVAGTGGLDLDTGAGTGSADAKAEVRDEGIVNDLTDGTWKQQISGVNGSELKYIEKGKNGVPETFAFNNVSFKEQIAALWSSGRAFTQKSTDNNRLVSDKVALGDVFILKNGTKYYMFSVKEIKITPETTGEDRNKDSYTFDVKY